MEAFATWSLPWKQWVYDCFHGSFWYVVASMEPFGYGFMEPHLLFHHASVEVLPWKLMSFHESVCVGCGNIRFHGSLVSFRGCGSGHDFHGSHFWIFPWNQSWLPPMEAIEVPWKHVWKSDLFTPPPLPWKLCFTSMEA